MKKSAIIFTVLLLAACQGKAPIQQPDPLDGELGNNILIMNNGAWGANDASISIYDIKAQSLQDHAFVQANGTAMGDLAQDILELGDSYFIAMNGSHLIYITDKDLKKKSTLFNDTVGGFLSPRYFCTDGKKVYVSLYEGAIAELNPADLINYRICHVGPNPEGLAYANGKIYVANSGGYLYPDYNNTVSVVNANSFKEVSTITVNCNPKCMVANEDGSLIYVSSLGNYADIPAKLQTIDTATGEVKDTEYTGVNSICKGNGNTIHILCGEYDASYALTGTVYTINAANGERIRTLASGIKNAYSLSASTEKDCVFVGISDYKNTGELQVYHNGELESVIATMGINPEKALLR